MAVSQSNCPSLSGSIRNKQYKHTFVLSTLPALRSMGPGSPPPPNRESDGHYGIRHVPLGQHLAPRITTRTATCSPHVPLRGYHSLCSATFVRIRRGMLPVRSPFPPQCPTCAFVPCLRTGTGTSLGHEEKQETRARQRSEGTSPQSTFMMNGSMVSRYHR